MGIGAKSVFVIRDQDRGWKALKRALTTLAHGDSYAKAGIIGEKAQQEHETEPGQAATNVDIGVWNEFGTGKAPARSFIREPFDANREAYVAMMTKFVAGVYEGKMEIGQALGLVGQRMESDFRNAIAHGIPPPNAPSTIAAKGSSKPLVDRGELRQAISSAVVLHGNDGNVVNLADRG